MVVVEGTVLITWKCIWVKHTKRLNIFFFLFCFVQTLLYVIFCYLDILLLIIV